RGPLRRSRMNSIAPQVIVVGSYNRDHVWRVDRFPQPGETRLGHDFSTGPGGKGFNQAVACHRQGVDTLFNLSARSAMMLLARARKTTRETNRCPATGRFSTIGPPLPPRS